MKRYEVELEVLATRYIKVQAEDEIEASDRAVEKLYEDFPGDELYTVLGVREENGEDDV